jgi:hypothetical protein
MTDELATLVYAAAAEWNCMPGYDPLMLSSSVAAFSPSAPARPVYRMCATEVLGEVDRVPGQSVRQ